MSKQEETLARINDYDGEANHYLLIWDDPMVMEIRNEKQLRKMFEECKAYDSGDMLLCGERRFHYEAQSNDIDEIMAHLNKEKEVTIGEMRNPSPQYVMDKDGYVRIRRIYNNGD
jgi:hypothetical protein